MADRVTDVVIVGAGPNGLTAATVLGMSGLSVTVLEANDAIGGGCRTDALTLDGYRHDVCAAIHPMAVVSPIFKALRLADHGLRWASADFPLAHPLDDGRVALLSRRLDETCATLGVDGAAWERLVRPFVDRHADFFAGVLRPVRVPPHPLLMARFGWLALQSSERLRRRFADAPAQALFSGNAAHSCLSLTAAGSAAFGLVLSVAGHAVDWPCVVGGSQRLIETLSGLATKVGCRIVTGTPVRSLADLPPSRAVLFDVSPRQLAAIAGTALPPAYLAGLRHFQYGAGVFKIDYALSGPIPWTSPACARAATVHVGGTAEDIALSEALVTSGAVSDTPFVLVAQQSHMDSTRAPRGHHTGWAYCHVPHGADIDMTDRIERQIERFAPGFRDVVLARHTITPRWLESHNANMIGGDIGGGANVLRQFLFRPTVRWNPYTTGHPRFYLCSSSTPPGGGVHGMCGYWAARTVLRRTFQRNLPEHLAF